MPAPAATIPMPGDLAELIGPAAEGVENRSLLLDKFVFHKKWPVLEETTRRGRDVVKWDEASRWSFLRIADGAEKLLRKEAAAKRQKAGGRNVEPENKHRYLAEARIAETLANTRWDSKELAELRASHTRRFLSLFHTAYGDRAAIAIGQLEGRLAINLADSLIQNAGICLDRLFGLPFIPGSAIKGVCRHAALEELANAKGEEREKLFRTVAAVFGAAENDFEPAKPARRMGDKDKPAGSFFPFLDLTKPLDQKGAIAFLPAYPVNPETRIVVDLTNVHYPDYYRSGREGDQKKENPRPNPFPAVEIGAQFAFCLVLNGIDNDPALLEQARRWLESALTVRGLGAKTAAGYGWFSIQPDALRNLFAQEEREAEAARQKAEQARAAAEAAAAEDARKADLAPEAAAAEDLSKLNDEAFALFARQIADKDEVQQRAFLTLLRENKEKRERWKTWKKKKPEIASGINETAAKLNLPPPAMTSHRLTFIAPLFSKGSYDDQPEIRPPSIRGQLHWWFRALGGSHADEKSIFGGVHDDPVASKVVVRVNNAHDGQGKPLQKAEIDTLPHKRGGQASPKWAFKPGATFDLHVTERLGGLDETQRRAFRRALEAWLLAGALGLRATRAGGSFIWQPLTEDAISMPATPEAYAKRLAEIFQNAPLRVHLLQRPFSNAEAARGCVSDTLGGRDNREGQSDLARLRDPLGRAFDGRKTSPLRFRIVQFGSVCHIVATWDDRTAVTGNQPGDFEAVVNLLSDRGKAIGPAFAQLF